MAPEERDPGYLWDMLEAAEAAAGFTEGLSFSQFAEDEREIIRTAVERKLEILGEAARRLSPAFRQAHRELPRRKLIGLRNLISHEYDRVDYKVIYRIVKTDIPRLIAQLEVLLPPAPEASA